MRQRTYAVLAMAAALCAGCGNPPPAPPTPPPGVPATIPMDPAPPARPAKPACAAAPAETKPPRPAGAAAAKADTSLLDRIGGPKAVAAIVKDTLARAAQDPDLAPRFEGANLPRFEKGLLEHLVHAMGGPRAWKGADLRTSHAGMGITEAEYLDFADAFAAALEKAGIAQRERDEAIGVFAGFRRDVVAPRPDEGERLARLEARLAAIEEKLDDALAYLEARRAPAPAGSAALAPTKGSVFAAAPAPDPAAINPAFKGPKWTPEEKRLAPALVARLTEPGATAEGEPRDDLLGRRLPRTRLLSSTGDVLDLRDLEGSKKVVLVILRGFAGSVCLHCSAQAMAISKAIDQFRARGAEVVLVYPGHADSVPAFIQSVKNLGQGFEPQYPIALDVDLSLARALGIEGGLAKPTSLVIDERGIVRYAYVGKQPADRPSVGDLIRAIDEIGKP